MLKTPDDNNIQPSALELRKVKGALIVAPAFFRHSPAAQILVAEVNGFSLVRRSTNWTNAIRSSPSNARQTQGGRSTTDSTSQPTGPEPATANVSPP